MTESPGAPAPPAENAFLKAVRQPRVLLILLAAWAIIGALTEFFTSSGLFVDLHGEELDGVLGGRALSWESIPMAVLYLYCARSPERYRPVFWLALIEQVAAIVASIYHWGAGDFSVESVVIPIAVAGALTILVFLHLFEPKEPAQTVAGRV
ncbi:MAG TPA: hypothetical protein VFT91_06140 [Dehalococcoidia bacterium]|nr:hypothetical protein [Dehalococcoidia bacterium]